MVGDWLVGWEEGGVARSWFHGNPDTEGRLVEIQRTRVGKSLVFYGSNHEYWLGTCSTYRNLADTSLPASRRFSYIEIREILPLTLHIPRAFSFVQTPFVGALVDD